MEASDSTGILILKAKFKTGGRIKSIKVDLEYRRDRYPCFAEIVDEIYKNSDPKLNELFENGYLIGVEQINF